MHSWVQGYRDPGFPLRILCTAGYKATGTQAFPSVFCAQLGTRLPGPRLSPPYSVHSWVQGYRDPGFPLRILCTAGYKATRTQAFPSVFCAQLGTRLPGPRLSPPYSVHSWVQGYKATGTQAFPSVFCAQLGTRLPGPRLSPPYSVHSWVQGYKAGPRLSPPYSVHSWVQGYRDPGFPLRILCTAGYKATGTQAFLSVFCAQLGTRLLLGPRLSPPYSVHSWVQGYWDPGFPLRILCTAGYKATGTQAFPSVFCAQLGTRLPGPRLSPPCSVHSCFPLPTSSSLEFINQRLPLHVCSRPVSISTPKPTLAQIISVSRYTRGTG